MEFHNEKLLSRGLPELIATVTPYDIYPYLNVVAHPHKKERGVAGQAHTAPWGYGARIDLYPSIIAFHAHSAGTFSFQLWRRLLQVTLHEIGHVVHAGDEKVAEVSERAYRTDLAAHSRVEQPADEWADSAMGRILRDNPRLGQPPGALTGYLGLLVYRFKKVMGDYSNGRVAEWRASATEAQLSMSDLIGATCQWVDIKEVRPISEGFSAYYARRRWIAGVRVHEARRELGITRCHVSRTGRHYPMFNAAEAEQVFCWLRSAYGVNKSDSEAAPGAKTFWVNPDYVLAEGKLPF